MSEQNVSIEIRAKNLTDEAFRKVAGALKALDQQVGNAAGEFSSLSAHLEDTRRLADKFAGGDTIQRAQQYAAAIERVGGVAKLTAGEQADVNQVVQDAIAKYKALGQEAPAALRNLASQTRTSSGLFADLNGQLKATALGFISAQAVIGGVQGAVRTLTQFIGDSAAAFAQQERAVKQMTTALVAQGQATPAVIDSYKAMAAQFQRTTIHGDELFNEMQALLVQVGNVMPAEMERALQAAADLSSGLGIDLKQATLLVGKAFEGETSTLKRYGIVIDEAKLKTEGADAVLAAIQAKFGGQAQAEVETYAGRVKQLANAWSDLQEVTGEIIVTNPIVGAALRIAQERIQGGTGAVEDQTHSWSRLLRQISIFGAEAPNIVADWVERLEDAADASNKAASAKLFSPEFLKPMASHLSAAAEEAANLRKAIKEKEEAERQATQAAEAHAKTIQALRDQLSGDGAIKAARDMAEALRRLPPVQTLTREAQDSINKAMEDAIAVYRAAGRDVPPHIARIAAETVNLGRITPAVLSGITGNWAALGEQIKINIDWLTAYHDAVKKATSNPDLHLGVISKLPGVDIGKPQIPDAIAQANAKTRELIGSLGELGDEFITLAGASERGVGGMIQQAGALVTAWQRAADALEAYEKMGRNLTGREKTQLALSAAAGVVNVAEATGQGSTAQRATGGAFTGAQAGLAAGALFGAKFGPYGAAIGAAAGAVVGIVRGLNQGRAAVKDFAQSFGSFDALREKLNALGDEGERLWVNLTQRTGKGNLEQARQAIEAVTRALDEQNRKQLETVDTARQAGEEQIAAQEKVVAGIKARLDDLNGEYNQLWNSIKDEAPEEVMGVVEQQTRARMAQIDEERKAVETQMQAAQADLQQTMDRVAEGIDKAVEALEKLTARPWHVGVKFDVEDLELPGGLTYPGRHSVDSDLPSYDRGGVIRHDQVARVHANELIGPVDFMRAALRGALQDLGGGSVGTDRPIIVQLNVDGRELTRTVLRNQRQVLAAYGVR